MTLWLDDADVRIHVGDVLDVLPTLPDASVDCCVTSPPYWGLRDYGAEGQLGLEATPDEYVARMVAVFREVRRVLADHGTCWVNLGDSYAGSWGAQSRGNVTGEPTSTLGGSSMLSARRIEAAPRHGTLTGARGIGNGVKPKDLVGIPWRVAFALQADGWYLRSDIIWAKPNPMPESVTDRPTKAHEYVFLLSKRPRYWFDAEAVREPAKPWNEGRMAAPSKHESNLRGGVNGYVQNRKKYDEIKGANVRSVWQIATQPYAEAHFATYPEELVRRCLLAGCPVRVCRVCGRPSERIVESAPDERRPYVTVGAGPKADIVRGDGSNRPQKVLREDGRGGDLARRQTATVGWSDCGHNDYRPGVVLDPFLGSGTTAKVARDHGRHAVGIELNETYARLAADRLKQLSLLADGAA